MMVFFLTHALKWTLSRQASSNRTGQENNRQTFQQVMFDPACWPVISTSPFGTNNGIQPPATWPFTKLVLTRFWIVLYSQTKRCADPSRRLLESESKTQFVKLLVNKWGDFGCGGYLLIPSLFAQSARLSRDERECLQRNSTRHSFNY